MTITSEKKDSALTVFVNGRLDTVSAPALDDFLRDNLEGVSSLTFDFEQLEYICSSGLRTLLRTQKKMNGAGGMRFRHVNEYVQEVFELTGFDSIFTIEG